MTNKQIIASFIDGAKKGNNTNNSLFIVGDKLYSYGNHYILAKREADGEFWVNDEKVSKTTSGHRNMFRAFECRKKMKNINN